MLTLGGKITGLRRSAGLTQRQLAKRTGVAQSTISAAERDQRVPDLDTLRSLATGLGVSTSEIFRDVE